MLERNRKLSTIREYRADASTRSKKSKYFSNKLNTNLNLRFYSEIRKTIMLIGYFALQVFLFICIQALQAHILQLQSMTITIFASHCASKVSVAVRTFFHYFISVYIYFEKFFQENTLHETL